MRIKAKEFTHRSSYIRSTITQPFRVNMAPLKTYAIPSSVGQITHNYTLRLKVADAWRGQG